MDDNVRGFHGLQGSEAVLWITTAISMHACYFCPLCMRHAGSSPAALCAFRSVSPSGARGSMTMGVQKYADGAGAFLVIHK